MIKFIKNWLMERRLKRLMEQDPFIYEPDDEEIPKQTDDLNDENIRVQ